MAECEPHSRVVSSAPGVRASSPGPKRLIWCVNHRTLMQSEVPILRSLGWEVFIPKVIPTHDSSYRSAVVSYEFDATLSIPEPELRVLNAIPFYEDAWSPTEEGIVTEYFSAFISSFSFYTTPLSEAARKFKGQVIARVFGREHPLNYTELPSHTSRPDLIGELGDIGERFVFGQGYPNLAEIEDEVLTRGAHTIAVPMAPSIYDDEGRWSGGSGRAIFLCPAITDGGYYTQVYQRIKNAYGDLPHWVFGRQTAPVDDEAVLPYLSDRELVELYERADVFVYPSEEPRHLHYSPVEAMVVGTPVLYRSGSMLDVLAGPGGPGAYDDDASLSEAARRILAGDRALADSVRANQQRIIDTFAFDVARGQWSEVLP